MKVSSWTVWFFLEGRWVEVDSEGVEVEVSQEAMGAVEEASREPETGSVRTCESHLVISYKSMFLRSFSSSSSY